MADYQLTHMPSTVIRTVDQASIPDDPSNYDWIIYQAWLAVRNVPDPYVAPPPPDPVQDANARLDAGVVAALAVAMEVRNAVHAIPNSFTPGHFSQLMVQLNVLTDAFVGMLQAQADT